MARVHQVVKDLVESQRQEVIHSVSGRVQYHLLPLYNHLGVSSTLDNYEL